MDNKKFEQLIDLVINENEEQARALFHDIVVEKSREIYENMMHDEMDEGMDGIGGQVGQMMDEISAEEEGMTEEEDEAVDFDDEDDEDIVDIETDDEMGDDEGVEERLVSIEDKLDQLMAEFEEIMGNEDEMGGDESDAEFDDSAEEAGADLTHDMEQDHDEEGAMMEAITLKKVSVTHGDNGQNTKSTSLQNSGQAGMDSRPVKFSGASETVPTSPKGPSNFYSKGETQVKDANKWKNAPAQNNADLEKAPAPKKGDDGSNAKSPVAESRKPVKRRI
jgi:hypothetical protein